MVTEWTAPAADGQGEPIAGTAGATYDTGALSDAMDLLRMHGAVTGIHPLTVARRVWGRAVTVRLEPIAADVAATGTSLSQPARHLCTAAVEASGPGWVIVVAHPGGRAAGWGGLLSLAAHLRGVEGVIVDGPCRDVDEARELGFAVYGRSATPVTARGRIGEVSWNEPVDIAGCVVRPGDLVVADSSGVVFVDSARADEVLATAASIAQREDEFAGLLRGGAPVSSVMSGRYERMVDAASRVDGK